MKAMEDKEMRRRIDTAFEFLGRVAEHPERFPDEAVLFILEPSEVASVITKERLRILRELEAKEYPSLVALAEALGRDVSRVRKDLLVLERLDLVGFSKSGNRLRVRPTATGIYIPLFAPKDTPRKRRAATR
jgi:predicted transcriptional regulator